MARSLHTYQSKRNFQTTKEPQGEVAVSSKRLRYCIQHHLARRDHYDFRLEWQGVMLSWAVPKGPSYNPKDKRLAIRVEDHPLEYREFEGTIPKGEYGGGTVMLWDEGYWKPHGDVEQSLAEGVLKFTIQGKRLKGAWALIRLREDDSEKENWLLLKEHDKYVKDEAGIGMFQTGVRSGQSMEEIASGKEKNTSNPFSAVEVQLAKLAREIPQEDGWVYETKYDGYRIVAFIEQGKVKLMTRNQLDYTAKFPSVASAIAAWAGKRSMVLDGEMIVADEEGKSDFQALQNYLRGSQRGKLVYVVFDLLAFQGEDLRDQSLKVRKQKLKQVLADAPDVLHYSSHVEGNGEQCFAVACQTGMEGIVGKRIHASYQTGKTGDWIKLKCVNRQEFVVGGYLRSDKKEIRSVLLGYYEGKHLIYAGKAGTGISQKDAALLKSKWKHLIRNTSPFADLPKMKEEDVVWLKPELVVEIRFAQWTREGLLRQASYQGIREDKDPLTVHRE